MIDNRKIVIARLEPTATGGAESPWVRLDSSAEQAEVRGKRILIVDDEESLRACLRMMLEWNGHQVTQASNGAEALNLFTVGGFDLVITDFDMPVMRGDELAAAIKLLAPAQMILMITGSARARRGVENPVDALLYKPFSEPELQGALVKLLPARPELAQPGFVPILESPAATFATL
jgi:CheY-like chemotaxis protein